MSKIEKTVSYEVIRNVQLFADKAVKYNAKILNFNSIQLDFKNKLFSKIN